MIIHRRGVVTACRLWSRRFECQRAEIQDWFDSSTESSPFDFATIAISFGCAPDWMRRGTRPLFQESRQRDGPAVQAAASAALSATAASTGEAGDPEMSVVLRNRWPWCPCRRAGGQ